MVITLDAERRTERGTRVRRMGKLPAIMYGAIKEPVMLAVDPRAFELVLRDAGESTLLAITVDGKQTSALIHDISRNATNNAIEHIDFYAVDKKQDVHVDVPVTFTGVAPAEKNGGAVTKVLHEISVSCLPDALPHEFTVDLSTLVDMDSAVRIKDLVVPKGVTLMHQPDDVIAAVVAQAEEEAPAVAEEQPEPEVTTKEKKEEGEAA